MILKPRPAGAGQPLGHEGGEVPAGSPGEGPGKIAPGRGLIEPCPAQLAKCLEKGLIADHGAHHVEQHGPLAVPDGAGCRVGPAGEIFQGEVVGGRYEGGIVGQEPEAVIPPGRR